MQDATHTVIEGIGIKPDLLVDPLTEDEVREMALSPFTHIDRTLKQAIEVLSNNSHFFLQLKPMRFENLLDIGYRIDIPITMYSILYTSIDRISSGNLLKSVIFCSPAETYRSCRTS